MRTFLYRLKENIKRKLNPVNHEKKFNEAYAAFLKTGETSTEGYMAFVNMYCKTNGKFTEAKHQEVIKNNPPTSQTGNLKGIIGEFNQQDFKNTTATLNKDGYVGFEGKIPSELIEKIKLFALKTPSRMAPAYDNPVIFNPNNFQSEIYRFDQQDLVNNTDIQELIMDSTFINIAREYLQCEPIFDFPAMWWSTSFLKEASEEAAQLFHFDLDRLKWLKIFIYLTDVNDKNGPHQLIKGSHLPGAKPAELLKRGYARISDKDIFTYHKKEDLIIVIGEAGSVFAEDTRCWHKGTPLISGCRLVLEFEYTSSMFGANYPKYIMKNYSEKFKDFCNNNPIYSSNFIFN